MIPKDKSDSEAVARLKAASEERVAPLVPTLLEWLQDINWPVARPIAEVLREHPTELVEPIRAVLNGDDDIWKFWVLAEVVLPGEGELRLALESEVLRIVNHPTPGEVDEEVHLIARDVLFVVVYNDHG